MERMMAYCGLKCSQCPAYLATQANDQGAREKVAARWSKMLGMNLSAGDINCDGCKSAGGRLFGHCRTCQIKQCCSRKGYATCAGCDEYACEALTAFFAFAPHARTALEALRSNPE
ncbi:MAG: DUF3795 domain-containing protein [Desulfobacteraceae bacterium]|nr:MAG: DUF3795 domain-containing protein [Desulfobacteraceae bacterium]